MAQTLPKHIYVRWRLPDPSFAAAAFPHPTEIDTARCLQPIKLYVFPASTAASQATIRTTVTLASDVTVMDMEYKTQTARIRQVSAAIATELTTSPIVQRTAVK